MFRSLSLRSESVEFVRRDITPSDSVIKPQVLTVVYIPSTLLYDSNSCRTSLNTMLSSLPKPLSCFLVCPFGLARCSHSFKPSPSPRGSRAKRRWLSLSSVGGGHDLHGKLHALLYRTPLRSPFVFWTLLWTHKGDFVVYMPCAVSQQASLLTSLTSHLPHPPCLSFVPHQVPVRRLLGDLLNPATWPEVLRRFAMAHLRYSRALFSRHGRGEWLEEGHPLPTAVEVMGVCVCVGVGTVTCWCWYGDFAKVGVLFVGERDFLRRFLCFKAMREEETERFGVSILKRLVHHDACCLPCSSKMGGFCFSAAAVIVL